MQILHLFYLMVLPKYLRAVGVGLADPAPVAQTFFVDEAIKQGARLDAIVTVVDAVRSM